MNNTKSHSLFPRGRLALLLRIRILVLMLAAAVIAGNALVGDLQSFAMPGLVVLTLTVATFVLWLRCRHDDEGRPAEAFLQLCIDVFLVVIGLALSGAAANPFVFLLIVPVALAAALLPSAWAAAVALLSIGGYTALLFLPTGMQAVATLHADHGTAAMAFASTHCGANEDFAHHLWGMWIAFIVTTVFVGAFVSWIAANLRERQAALAELERRQLLEQKVIALATFSASAAHQLGTPMSIIRVTAADLLDDEAAAPLREPLARIRDQALACTRILRQLSRIAQGIDEGAGEGATLHAQLSGIAEELRVLRPETIPVIDIRDNDGELRVRFDGGLRQALLALLDNAAKASPNEVRVECERNGGLLQIKVLDRGAGLHGGERANEKRGLGIGILLARAALERRGGCLEYFARDDVHGRGTVACASIPMSGLIEDA